MALENARLLVDRGMFQLRRHDPRLLPVDSAEPMPVQEGEQERAVGFGAARSEHDLPGIHAQKPGKALARFVELLPCLCSGPVQRGRIGEKPEGNIPRFVERCGFRGSGCSPVQVDHVLEAHP